MHPCHPQQVTKVLQLVVLLDLYTLHAFSIIQLQGGKSL